MWDRRHASRVGLVAAVALLLPALTVAVPSASARPGEPAAPTLDWQPCGADLPGIACARAKVPLDYDRPAGATTSVALARVPATNQANRIGTVFVNPGGPGGSGVDLVLSGYGSYLQANFGGRFDVVGFDPRGVGASDPLHCFASRRAVNEYLASQPIFPYRSNQYRPFFDAFSGLADRCLDGSDAIARHMSTADVARDMDLLRRAVGDAKLSYLGYSYGSYLGNTYANLFPQNVRALVIDGVLDPRLWSSGSQIKSDRVATQHEFSEFLRLCDEAATECAFTGPQGARARWRALAKAVEARPIDVGGRPYTYDFLIGDATSAMYAPESWDYFAALFDELADAVAGDRNAATAAGALRASLIERLSPAPPKEPHYDNGFDAYYGNQCADTQYPHTFEAFKEGDRFAAAGSRFGPLWWWGNAGCAHWPVAEDRYVGPWTARTSAPVLVVGNFFDGVTDYAGAQASAKLLKNSRLLSFAGYGHTAYDRSVCVRDYVRAYFIDGTLPPQGTVCPAPPNPFQPSGLRTAASALPAVGLPPEWLLHR